MSAIKRYTVRGLTPEIEEKMCPFCVEDGEYVLHSDHQHLSEDMAMLIRRMCRRLQLTGMRPNIELAAKALEFLQRKGLQGSLLRTDGITEN